jgi:hypothetical protein
MVAMRVVMVAMMMRSSTVGMIMRVVLLLGWALGLTCGSVENARRRWRCTMMWRMATLFPACTVAPPLAMHEQPGCCLQLALRVV